MPTEITAAGIHDTAPELASRWEDAARTRKDGGNLNGNKVALASPCQHQVLRIPSKGKLTPFFCRYRTKLRFNALLRRPATQERHIAVFCHDGCRKGSVNRTAGFLVAEKTAFVQSAELAAQTLIVHGREYSQLIPV